MDDLAFVGFAQSAPTLFPFVECQSRLVAAYAAGRYRLPPVAEMERVIEEDEQKYLPASSRAPAHTQQVDYFLYEHDMRTKELPAGARRAKTAGAPVLAGRA